MRLCENGKEGLEVRQKPNVGAVIVSRKREGPRDRKLIEIAAD